MIIRCMYIYVHIMIIVVDKKMSHPYYYEIQNTYIYIYCDWFSYVQASNNKNLPGTEQTVVFNVIMRVRSQVYRHSRRA